MDPSEQFLHIYGQNLSRILCPSAPQAIVQGAIRQALQETREDAVSRGLLPGTVEKSPAMPSNAQRWELCFVHDCRPAAPTGLLVPCFANLPAVSGSSCRKSRVAPPWHLGCT